MARTRSPNLVSKHTQFSPSEAALRREHPHGVVRLSGPGGIQPYLRYKRQTNVAAGAARATSAPLATLRRVTHSAAGGGLGRTLDVAYYAAPRRATDPDPVARRVPLAPVQAKPIPVRHAVSPNPVRRGRDTAHPAGRRPRSARPRTAMSRRWPLFFLSVVHFSGARRRRSWAAALLVPPATGRLACGPLRSLGYGHVSPGRSLMHGSRVGR